MQREEVYSVLKDAGVEDTLSELTPPQAHLSLPEMSDAEWMEYVVGEDASSPVVPASVADASAIAVTLSAARKSKWAMCPKCSANMGWPCTAKPALGNARGNDLTKAQQFACKSCGQVLGLCPTRDCGRVLPLTAQDGRPLPLATVVTACESGHPSVYTCRVHGGHAPRAMRYVHLSNHLWRKRTLGSCLAPGGSCPLCKDGTSAPEADRRQLRNTTTNKHVKLQ